MKKSIKWILIVIGVLVVAVAVFAYVTKGKFFATQSASTTAAAAQAAQTVKVTKGSLTVTIATTGSVRPAQTAVLNWQVTGKVGTVPVKLGQKVNANDVLATIDQSTLPQSLIQAQSDLITAQQALANLNDSAATNESTALQTLAAAQLELTNATTARASLQYARASQDTIAVAQANVAMAQADYDTAANRYDNLKSRPETDTLRAQALSNMAAAKQNLNKDLANLTYLQSGPVQNDIDQADARVQVAKTKLADAQRLVNQWKAGPSQDDITLAKNKIVIAQAAVNQSQIVAPFSGTITALSTLPGNMVTPTTVAMQIDDLSSQYVDMQVTELDVNKLQVGQPTVITFDAVPNKRYQAKVTQVGQVGTTTSGVVYYTITAQLTNADQFVKSGMTASATVTVSSTDNVLLVPSRSVRTLGTRHIVYKPGPTAGSSVPTFVQVGASNDTETEITNGLNVGDVILANPPALTATGAGARLGGIGGIFGGGGGGGGGGNFQGGAGGARPSGGAGGPTGGGTGGTTGGGTAPKTGN